VSSAIVIALRGVTTFDEDELVRLVTAGIWVGGGVLYLIVLQLTTVRRRGRGVVIDERGRMIMGRAVKWQLLGVIFGLVVWGITLTEVYWNQGAVPIVFINLIVMSSLGMMLLGQALGILVGYWTLASSDDYR
jgi:nitric oxide reductase large subunit